MRRISFVLVLAAAACHHETVSPPSNQAAPARPSASADALAFLPLEADILFGIDVAALRGSPIWGEYQSKMTERLGPEIGNVQKLCGFDPFQTVASVTFALSSKEVSDSVVVVRGLDRDRTTACLKNKAIPNTTVATDRDVLLLTSEAGTHLLTFADASTLVVKAQKQQTPDALRAVVQGGAPLRTSAGFIETFNQLETGATAWLVVNGNSPIFDRMAGGVGARPRAIYGTLRAGNGVSAKVHVRMSNANEASQLASMGKSQTQQAAAMFDRLDVTSEGDVMSIALELSLDKLRSLVSMMTMMAGASPPSPPSP